MKKIILLVAFFTCGSLFAQSGWFPLNSGTASNLLSVYFTDANSGYATGVNGTVLKTTNAGENWYQQASFTTDQLRSVFFTDLNTGYAASGSGNGTSTIGAVYKSTNAGVIWSPLSLPKSAHFYCLYFINSNIGFASGWQTILKTTNAGITWIENQTFPGLGYITSLYFIDSNTGFASELNYKKILKTTDGGNSWQEIFTANTMGFFGISFADANTGVAVGGSASTAGSALILRTTNGGINWSNFAFTDYYYFWSARFIAPGIGYSVGGNPSINGIIMKTTNGGSNWYHQTTNANNVLRQTFFTNLNTGYVVGNAGIILKTTDGGGALVGINSITNQTPNNFSLSQNYPNPFNPQTVIRYHLPEISQVSLKIFDVNGREVKTLVNEMLKAGSYEITFDGSYLNSGVYFCSMQANKFKDVIKLILLK